MFVNKMNHYCTVIRKMLCADGAKGREFLVLCRFIWLQIRFVFQKEFIYKWVNNIKIYIVHHRSASTECYYYGLFDPEEMSLIRDTLKPGDVVADVGANIGGYSVFCASYGAEVYAFEPVPSTFDLLERNISINVGFSNLIHPIRKVVSDSEGEVNFTIDNDTVNKIVSDDHLKENTSNVVKIPAVTLDSVIDKVNILKIDVEGFEKAVLGGAKRLLASPDLRLVVLEDPDEEIISLLDGYGFSQCRYDLGNKKVTVVAGDQNKPNGIFMRNPNVIE